MERKIWAYKCKRCGHIHYPYKTVCKKCKANDHNEFDLVPLPEEGKLLTFTHLYTLPGDYETMSISLGIVELSNGMRINAQLEVKEPLVGMNLKGRVDVVRRDEYNKYYGMIFSEA